MKHQVRLSTDSTLLYYPILLYTTLLYAAHNLTTITPFLTLTDPYINEEKLQFLCRRKKIPPSSRLHEGIYKKTGKIIHFSRRVYVPPREVLELIACDGQFVWRGDLDFDMHNVTRFHKGCCVSSHTVMFRFTATCCNAFFHATHQHTLASSYIHYLLTPTPNPTIFIFLHTILGNTWNIHTYYNLPLFPPSLTPHPPHPPSLIIPGDTWNIHTFNDLLEDALCFPDEHPGLQYILRSVNGNTPDTLILSHPLILTFL